MKNKVLIFETAIYFIGSMLVSILGFIISILYAKMFSPSDYGEYSLAFSTYSLIVSVYGGWIGTSIIRNYTDYSKKNMIEKFYASFMQIIVYMFILFFSISNIILNSFKISGNKKSIFIILSIVFFFEQTLLVINTMLRTNGNAKQYSINTVLNNIFKIVFLLVIYYILKIKSINIIVISLLVSQITQFIYLCYKYSLWKYYNTALFDFNIIKKMFLYGFPMVGVSLTTWILSTSDRYIIKIFYNDSQVGLYSYSYSLGNSLFNMLTQFIMLGAFPNIIKTWENKGKEETKKIITKYLKLYFYIIVPACFGIVCISKDMFQVITDIRYFESYTVFMYTCIGITILGITQYTNKAWEVTKKPKVILILNICAAVINVILNFIFIPLYGYKVAAITTVISHIIYLAITTIFSRNILPLKIDFYSLMKVIVSASIMIISMKFVKIHIFMNKNTFFILIIECLIGLFVYLSLMFLLKEFDYYYIKKIINKKLNILSRKKC